MITKKQCFVWMSYDANDCKPQLIAPLKGKLELAQVMSQSGSNVPSTTPDKSSLGVGFTNFECGVQYIQTSVGGELPYEVLNIKESILESDSGRIHCLYPEDFVVESYDPAVSGLPGQGLYKMTTTFYKNKPTYTNGNGWWITWQSPDWMLSNGFPPNFDKSTRNGYYEPQGGDWAPGNTGVGGPTPTPTPTPTPAPSYDGADFCIEDIPAKFILENQPKDCTPHLWKGCLGRSVLSRNGNVMVVCAANDTVNLSPSLAYSGTPSLIVLDWDGSEWVQRGTLIHPEGWISDRGTFINTGPERIKISDDGNKVCAAQMYKDSVSGNYINSVRVWEWRQFQESDVGNYYHYNLFQDVNTAQKKKTIITYDISTDDPVAPVVGEYYWTQRGNDINSRLYSSGDSSQVYQVSANSDFTQLFILTREPHTHNMFVQRVFEWSDEVDDWVQKGFDIQCFRSSAYYQNRRITASASQDKFIIEAWNSSVDMNDHPLWIMAFEWRQFTEADIFKYVHGTRTHVSNKPIIITGNGPNGSTDVEPVSGEFYWTQVGLTIEEIFDVSYNGTRNPSGLLRENWTMAVGQGRNYDVDGNFETIAILNSGKTVCFYKLQKVGQDMRWVKQSYIIELPNHVFRHHIVLSNYGNRLLVVGEGPALTPENEISVYGYYLNEESQEWVQTSMGQPEGFELPVDRRQYFKATDAIKKVNNDFVWSLDAETFSNADRIEYGDGNRSSIYVYKTTQNCLADGPQGPVGSYSIFGDAFVNGYDTTTMFFRIEKSSNIVVGDVVVVNDVNFTHEFCGTDQPTMDLNGTIGTITKVTEVGEYIDIEFLHNQDVISSCAGTYSDGGTITLQD